LSSVAFAKEDGGRAGDGGGYANDIIARTRGSRHIHVT
jgi:5-formyltetrahydrofolate cyclo-ligase